MPASTMDRMGLAALVAEQTRQCLAAYAAKPNLVEQDAGIEISSVEGGYGRKQLHELAQNGSDALVGSAGRLALVLTSSHLYCANEGSPLDARGIEALMASHLSTKRDEQIGRFGLGFKSVLGISDSPEIISRSLAIRFDRAHSERLIRQISPHAVRTAVLRIGVVFDAAEAARSDPTLAGLLTWATTVVRLPLKSGTDWLGAELVKFPPEFLLFTPHISRLDLQGGPGNQSASWRATRDGNRVELQDRTQSQVWQVFRATHVPSPAAHRDAGEITGRAQIEVTWAIPRKGRNRDGAFWAYFPTNSKTTLSGVVNAPFKTNDDRHDLLDGIYNREILTEVLPKLISQNFADLIDSADPCSVLEILPARGREIRSWADDAINEPILQAVVERPCLPDLDGRLLHSNQVWLMPEFLVDRPKWVDRWVSTPGRVSNWVHPSVNKDKERRAKATRLQGLLGRQIATVDQWLGDIAKGETIAGSETAIVLASLINDFQPDQIAEMRKALIVRTATGSVVPALSRRVFVADGTEPTSSQFVDISLLSNAETAAALTKLGIGRLDPVGKLGLQIQNLLDGATDGLSLSNLWLASRQLQPVEAAKILIAGFGPGRTPVRVLAGKRTPVWNALLPGTVVPADGSRDAEWTIDTAFHRDDLGVLDRLGALADPRLGQPRADELWYSEWVSAAQDAYMTKASAEGRRVPVDNIIIGPGRTASRLDLLAKLSEAGKVALTESILRVATEPWHIDSTTRALKVAVSFTNPGLWWARKHGLVHTALGPFPLARALGPGLPADLLPVAQLAPELIKAIELPNVPRQTDWSVILPAAVRRLELVKLHQLYGLAASHEAKQPENVKVARGAGFEMTAPEDCMVTSDVADYDALTSVSEPAVLVPDRVQARTLIERWHMIDATGFIHRETLAAASGESQLLVDRFPGLKVIRPDLAETIELVPCSDLAVEIIAGDQESGTIDSRSVLRELDVVYHRDNLSNMDLLTQVGHLLHLGLRAEDLHRVEEIARRNAANSDRIAVRNAGSVGEKILKMAGEDAVRKLVPNEVISLVEKRSGKKMSLGAIADMAANAQGSQLIRKLSPAIEKRGFAPPKQMTGGTQAREWARDLRLPETFIGQQDVRPPSREEIFAPSKLPKLHDYQLESVARMKALLQPGGPNRGLLALPTGSGKTRVAVESVVHHIDESRTRPLILWIAQTEELCEQAAETWTYVWRAIGTSGSRMVLSRLWGSNEATHVLSGVHLVVATDDKLDSISKKTGYAWLSHADIVIVDEAHTSVTKTYTSLFNWLGRGARERDKPLIGLSATPFRGNNEDQTTQLVNRYDKNLLTEGVFGDEDPHTYLQRAGILANVRHEELEGIRLTPANDPKDAPDDERALRSYAIDQGKVAADEQRNIRILDSIEQLPEATTALVFAASVQHGEMLASVLTQEGVPAASVSAFSPPSERRRIVQQFREGKIRVVTNYNVLSQGFDAPKVGAVYVARPTFSPNRYQQMIGRGLRGPKNGGSESVLIVNIKDNIDAFGEQLAFHHFDWLWNRQ